MLDSSHQNLQKFLKYSGFGIQMGITIAAFGWLGYELDDYFETERRFITLIMLLLGTAGSIVLLIRSLSR